MQLALRSRTRTKSRTRQSTAIVLDDSGSMCAKDFLPSRAAVARAAARAFIEEKARHFPEDEVSILVFGDTVKVVHRPAIVAASLESLLAAIPDDLLVACGGSTNMSPALTGAHALLETSACETRSILFLADGGNTGRFCPVESARGIKAASVQISVVGIGSDDGTFDEATLRGIASPGCYRFISDGGSLVAEFRRVATTRLALVEGEGSP